MAITPTEKFTCDRCGFDFKKSELRKQRGMYLSHDCFDKLDRIPTHRPRFNPPRDDSTSTGVPTSIVPSVLTVSAVTGVNQLFQSHELSERRDNTHKSIFMKVVSDGGAITVTADPPIVAGYNGQILTLQGTSDTDTVKLEDTGTLMLNGASSITLKAGDTINLVYNIFSASVGGWGTSMWGSTGYGFGGATEGWVEASRYKGGF